MERPERMFARVAMYADAITAAKKSGYTWRELLKVLAPIVGVKDERRLADTFKRAVKAIEDGRLCPEQLELPGSKAVISTGNHTEKPIAERPLPTVPGTIPSEEEERRKRLEAKGVKFY